MYSMVLIKRNIFQNDMTQCVDEVMECVLLLSKFEIHFDMNSCYKSYNMIPQHLLQIRQMLTVSSLYCGWHDMVKQ